MHVNVRLPSTCMMRAMLKISLSSKLQHLSRTDQTLLRRKWQLQKRQYASRSKTINCCRILLTWLESKWHTRQMTAILMNQASSERVCPGHQWLGHPIPHRFPLTALWGKDGGLERGVFVRDDHHRSRSRQLLVFVPTAWGYTRSLHSCPTGNSAHGLFCERACQVGDHSQLYEDSWNTLF